MDIFKILCKITSYCKISAKGEKVKMLLFKFKFN